MDGKGKNEHFLWIALTLLILSSVVGLSPNPAIKLIAWALGGIGFGLFARDFIQLKKQGAKRLGWYWLFFLPGYLWKRGKVLEQDGRLTWAAGALLALCILMPPLSAWIAQNAMVGDMATRPVQAQQPAVSKADTGTQSVYAAPQENPSQVLGLESMIASHLSPPDGGMRRGEWVMIGPVTTDVDTVFRAVTDDAMESGSRYSPTYMLLDYSQQSQAPSISILTPVLSSVEEAMESYGWIIFNVLVDGK